MVLKLSSQQWTGRFEQRTPACETGCIIQGTVIAVFVVLVNIVIVVVVVVVGGGGGGGGGGGDC